jgi:hypothetical protein
MRGSRDFGVGTYFLHVINIIKNIRILKIKGIEKQMVQTKFAQINRVMNLDGGAWAQPLSCFETESPIFFAGRTW